MLFEIIQIFSLLKLWKLVGYELLELIHWSTGELMYMYCYTIAESSDRLEKNRSHFLQVSLFIYSLE